MKGEGGGFLNFIPEGDLDATAHINRLRFPYKHKTHGKNFYVDKISVKLENKETSPKKYYVTYAVFKDSKIINPKDVIKYKYKDKDGNQIIVNLDEIGKEVDPLIDAIKLEKEEWHDPEGILERTDEFDWYTYEVVLPAAKVLDFDTMEEEEIEMYEMDGYNDGDIFPYIKICSIYSIIDKGEYGEYGTWVLGSFGGGSGTSGDPYIIETWTHLDDVRNYLTSSFELANDLTTSDADYLTFNDSATDGWEPIGDLTNSFTGTFDGQGYTISDLFIYRPTTEYIGLFGYIDTGGEVSNVGIVDVDVSGYRLVGGLAGRNGISTLDNSYATGTVSGYQYVGGLMGYNQGAVNNSYTVVNVICTYRNIGGIVGFNNNAMISNSYAIGEATGSSSDSQPRVGGLVGTLYGDDSVITDCYAHVNVSGRNYIGGLVGITGASSTNSEIYNSYSTGAVIENGAYCGGLIGFRWGGTITNSYWNTETSGKTSSDGGTARSTADMTDYANSYPTMSGFASNPWKDPPVDWNEDNEGNSGYPALNWQVSSIINIYNVFQTERITTTLTQEYFQTERDLKILKQEYFQTERDLKILTDILKYFQTERNLTKTDTKHFQTERKPILIFNKYFQTLRDLLRKLNRYFIEELEPTYTIKESNPKYYLSELKEEDIE